MTSSSASSTQQTVDWLVRLYDHVRERDTPAAAFITAQPGLGKTRVVQELYERLAVNHQGQPPYWPDRLWPEQTVDILRDRKRLYPTEFTIPGSATMPRFWWELERLCRPSIRLKPARSSRSVRPHRSASRRA